MAATDTRVSTRSRGDVAPRLANALRPFVGQGLPVRLRAWDGSEAGPEDARPWSSARGMRYAD